MATIGDARALLVNAAQMLLYSSDVASINPETDPTTLLANIQSINFPSDCERQRSEFQECKHTCLKCCHRQLISTHCRKLWQHFRNQVLQLLKLHLVCIRCTTHPPGLVDRMTVKLQNTPGNILHDSPGRCLRCLSQSLGKLILCMFARLE